MPQYAIIKQKTKARNAGNYAAQVADGDTSLYFYFGNPVSWATVPGGSNDDTNPPAPKDTVIVEKQIWDGIIGLKKITSADLKRGFRRVNWVNGQYYDMYRDDYDGSTVTGVSLAGEYTNTKPLSLARSNSLVLVDDAGVFKLYRCIDNRSTTTGNPIASTTKPTFTTANIQTLADGYKWKFMGELSSTDISNFLTTSHCPLPSVAATAGASGNATAVVLTSRGEGYTSAPSLTVKGDGTGLTLGTPVVVSGRVVYIPITSVGTGYTYATVTFSGGSPTTAATAKIIVAPTGGFASNIEQEFEPNFLLICASNEETDDYFTTRGNAPTQYGTSDVTGLTYRVVGLLENPYNYGTTTVSTSSLLTNFKEYKTNIMSGSISYANRLTTATSGLSNPVATVVSVRDNTSSIVNTLSFNAATAVNGTTNELTSVGHNLITGDSLLYDNNGGTSVVGLTNGQTYYAIKISVDIIKLATSYANATLGSAISITPGIGLGHTLTQTVVQKYVGMLQTTEQLIENNPITSGNLLTRTDNAASLYVGPYVSFNGSSLGIVGVGTDILTIPGHPFKTGDSVVYSSGAGTAISTTGSVLVSGNTYYVIRISTNEIKLATSLTLANTGVAIDITGAGTGTTHTLTYSGSDSVYNPTVQKYSGNIIFTEYRNAVTRSTVREKFRFVLEF
jgi:hypothetical protein